MVMPALGDLMFPVSAQPARGPRYARLAVAPRQRRAQRNVVQRARHALDVIPVGTNHNEREACSATVLISARARLTVDAA
jgi:hypothetical protein